MSETVDTGVVKRKNGRQAAPTKRKAATVDQKKLDKFGFRVGSLKAQAVAMYSRSKGATLAQVKEALKSTQFNVLTELESKGFKIEREPVSGINNRKVTRYHLIQK